MDGWIDELVVVGIYFWERMRGSGGKFDAVCSCCCEWGRLLELVM